MLFAVIATIITPWEMCQGHPPEENLPVKVAADCSFSHAGKEHPISGGAAYRLENGMIAQTINHREGYCEYRTTLVVDCAARQSILIPNNGGIWGFEEGELSGDGPPLPHFLSEEEKQSVKAMAVVFGEVRTSFMARLRADEGGSKPDEFCGCGLPQLAAEQE